MTETSANMAFGWCNDDDDDDSGDQQAAATSRQSTKRRANFPSSRSTCAALGFVLMLFFSSSSFTPFRLAGVSGLSSRMEKMAANAKLHEIEASTDQRNARIVEGDDLEEKKPIANERQARISDANVTKPDERSARVLPQRLSDNFQQQQNQNPFRGGGYGNFQPPYMMQNGGAGGARSSPFGQLQQPQFDPSMLGGGNGGGMSPPFGGGGGGGEDAGSQMMGGGAGGGGFDPSNFGGGGGGGGGDGGLGGAGGQILPPPPGLLDRIRNGGMGFPNQMMGGGGGPPMPGGGGGPPMGGGGPPFGPPMMGGGGGGPQLPGRANFPPRFDAPFGGGPRARPDCDYNPEQGPRDCRRSKLSPFLCLASEKYPNDTAKYIAKKYDDVLKQHAYPDLDVADIYDGDRPSSSKKQETICDSEVLIIRPGYAINTEGQWRAVFQSEEFVQRLRVETCRQPKKPCKHIPGCHATECTQKYAYIRLLSFDTCNKEAGPTYSMYRVPTACECRLIEEPKTVGSDGDYGPMFNGGAAQNIQSTVKEMAKYGASGGDPKPAFA